MIAASERKTWSPAHTGLHVRKEEGRRDVGGRPFPAPAPTSAQILCIGRARPSCRPDETAFARSARATVTRLTRSGARDGEPRLGVRLIGVHGLELLLAD